jgi:hypothetical protein
MSAPPSMQQSTGFPYRRGKELSSLTCYKIRRSFFAKILEMQLTRRSRPDSSRGSRAWSISRDRNLARQYADDAHHSTVLMFQEMAVIDICTDGVRVTKIHP